MHKHLNMKHWSWTFTSQVINAFKEVYKLEWKLVCTSVWHFHLTVILMHWEELNTTASGLAPSSLLPQLLHALSYQLCNRRQRGLECVQMIPTTGGKVRQWWSLFGLSSQQRCEWSHESLRRSCCCMLWQDWDLERRHSWEWWRCYWSQSWDRCQH